VYATRPVYASYHKVKEGLLNAKLETETPETSSGVHNHCHHLINGWVLNLLLDVKENKAGDGIQDAVSLDVMH
jgi:hypothetical protein